MSRLLKFLPLPHQEQYGTVGSPTPAPSQDHGFSSSLTAIFPFNKVKFLWVNTTSMDDKSLQISSHCTSRKFSINTTKQHEVIVGITLNEFLKTKLNIMKAVRSSMAAWEEVSMCCLNAAWNHLQLEIQWEFDGLEEGAVVDKKTALFGD
jgi:hypothetical protein